MRYYIFFVGALLGFIGLIAYHYIFVLYVITGDLIPHSIILLIWVLFCIFSGFFIETSIVTKNMKRS